MADNFYWSPYKSTAPQIEVWELNYAEKSHDWPVVNIVS